VAVCLACGCAGCGGNGLTAVHGVVKLDGNPVANAVVYFNPQFEGGRQASATTDDKGRFELNTYGVGKGAAPGDYKVTVFKSPDADQRKKGIKDPPLPGPSGTRPLSVIPPPYDDLSTTTLRVTVPHSGDVTLELFTRK
jgi:hypothetical protein